MAKVLIIAKYADESARECLGRLLEDFCLQDSIWDSYTGKQLGVAEYYEADKRNFAESVLSECRKLNPSVGYDIVEVNKA